jgi:hypothetical protein
VIARLIFAVCVSVKRSLGQFVCLVIVLRFSIKADIVIEIPTQ